jgi:hypothetical protein
MGTRAPSFWLVLDPWNWMLNPYLGNKHANQKYCAAKNNLFPNQDQLYEEHAKNNAI